MKSVKSTLAAAAFVFAAGAAHAVPSLSFIIDGNTYTNPFAVTNTSDASESMLAFGIDLSGANADLCFDVVNGGVCNSSDGVPFTPISGATVSSHSVVDGGSTLDIAFSTFDAGSTFLFDIDVDLPGIPTIRGDRLIGATAYADFTGGQRLLGVFEAVTGNSDASAFTATGIIPTPQVPLPASLPLLAVGLAAMGAMRRKRATA